MYKEIILYGALNNHISIVENYKNFYYINVGEVRKGYLTKEAYKSIIDMPSVVILEVCDVQL